MPANWDKYGPAPPGTGDLSPLPPKLRFGLEFIGILAVFSLVLCTSLFLFITYRIIEGQLRERRRRKQSGGHDGGGGGGGADGNNSFAMEPPATPNTASMSTPSIGNMSPSLKHGPSNAVRERGSDESRRAAIPNIRQRYKGYHPLLVLIYMLLIADIIQSASMIPNLAWVARDAITVRSDTCWAQGWLRSQGDMASSLFAAAVSVNTWLTVVKRYTIPRKLLWAVIAFIWSFSIIIVAAGVWAADNGYGHGGYFVRVDTWCWISSEYAETRLWSHFCWVLASIGIIFVSYLSTVICFRPSARWGRVLAFRNPQKSGHHPAFLIYPLVYFICCVPMALGPMILLAGVTIKVEYFLWSGAMIASNGWLDVVIWSCTMFFLAPKEIKKVGLEDFRFMRTDSVKYGNIVWVEGGGRVGEHGGLNDGSGNKCLHVPPFPSKAQSTSKWWTRRPRPATNRASSIRSESRLVDADGGIQIETSTVVMVEDRRDSVLDPRHNTVRSHRRMTDIVSVPTRVAHLF